MSRHVVIVVALAAAFAAGAIVRPKAAQSQGAKRIELECAEPSGVNALRNVNKLMAERAADGWELVGISSTREFYCFRRVTP